MITQEMIDKLNKEVDTAIEEYGFFTFSVQGVGDYTVGFGKNDQFEIISPVNTGNIFKNIIHSLVERYHAVESGQIVFSCDCIRYVPYNPKPFTTTIIKPVTLDPATLKPDAFRLRLVPVEDEFVDFIMENVTLAVRKRYPKHRKFLQLQYADNKNILPGEPGYDENFKQSIRSLISRHQSLESFTSNTKEDQP